MNTTKPFSIAAEILAKKWSLIIVHLLIDGEKRFSELEKSIKDISPKVLSLTLFTLQKYGIVEREVETTSPIKVKYKLTEKGRELAKIVEEIREWSERWSNF
ncbi:transcriptional regulator, HxlR family [Ferroglobus placidus DSM 10642]|uniref:Transcriptional regulator, HxlR family n=1 Tax=Ferroglobus placidus (strain DSM 10642 / AEDII12DO) TaxID=589924 RepID=D3RXF9_FERPA|nr:helix-turn-helix domain-containing protein [Ferroglobus placidus]ADC65172.1 transcriptional regulator, HxlR family [Ferroglobus placidus DSM 10642]